MSRNEFPSETERRLGRYVWRGFYFNGGGWESEERRHVEPGTMRVIAGEPFYAFHVTPLLWGLRGYRVSWHRPDDPARGAPPPPSGAEP